jgi:hypothetical protein
MVSFRYQIRPSEGISKAVANHEVRISEEAGKAAQSFALRRSNPRVNSIS